MKLRDYQQKVVKAQTKFMKSEDQRGQIYSPTGSGKTICFDRLIDQLLRGNTDKRICIVYPRIALAQDQQTRLKSKRNVEFTSFHSGKNISPEDAVIYRNQKSTTNREELSEIRNTSDRNHITFVTYHSFPKIADMDFDLIICDEAHNLVQAGFAQALPKIVSKVLFYTATPIYKVDMLETVVGMNCKELFGDVICTIKPSQLIKKGYVVPPKLVELNVKSKGTGVCVEPHTAIAYAFMDQQTRLPNITNKMLVAMSSTAHFEVITDNLFEMRKLTGQNIDLYTVTASEQLKNGVPFSSRQGLLEEFDKNNNVSIIIHCDTLAEGIDVTGITGVFMFRPLSKSKLIQTIGRSARPSLLDLDENFEVKDMDNRVKPFSVVTIPVIDNDYYANVDTKTICEAFIEGGYGDDMSDITQFIEMEAKEIEGGNEDEPDYQAPTSIVYKTIQDQSSTEIKLNLVKIFA